MDGSNMNPSMSNDRRRINMYREHQEQKHTFIKTIISVLLFFYIIKIALYIGVVLTNIFSI